MNRLSTLTLLVVSGLTGLAPLSAHASCHGSGYSRFCDGIGGPGSTYSKPSSNGLTDYYDNGGLNKTIIRSSPGSVDSSLGSGLQIFETLRY